MNVTVGVLAQFLKEIQEEQDISISITSQTGSSFIAQIHALEELAHKINALRKRSKKSTPAPSGAEVHFDFESIYALYPNRKGKKRGMEICRREILTSEDFFKLRTAVENYARECQGREPQYIKHFSTFMNNWRDYEPSTGVGSVRLLDPAEVGT